ncbi:hypothetical protein EX30DRAFT_165756 [Ascodesmis nigricans]|uniref:Uncharacterized protein n=1 Tax=Ascodesmis nigricans TaxID=341454 RepID=A0A4S2MMC6_9PEZI|nr:hypothetical protein EX30DRAFT_165756 [Ascodesmis nigricans]
MVSSCWNAYTSDDPPAREKSHGAVGNNQYPQDGESSSTLESALEHHITLVLFGSWMPINLPLTKKAESGPTECWNHTTRLESRHHHMLLLELLRYVRLLYWINLLGIYVSVHYLPPCEAQSFGSFKSAFSDALTEAGMKLRLECITVRQSCARFCSCVCIHQLDHVGIWAIFGGQRGGKGGKRNHPFWRRKTCEQTLPQRTSHVFTDQTFMLTYDTIMMPCAWPATNLSTVDPALQGRNARSPQIPGTLTLTMTCTLTLP